MTSGEKKKFWTLKQNNVTQEPHEPFEHPPFVAHIPRTNLLPASVREKISLIKIQKILKRSAVAVIVVAAVLWLLQIGNIQSSENRLAAAQLESASIAANVAVLAPVGQLYQQITNQENFINDALASESVSSKVFATLQRVAGPKVDYTNITMNFTGIPRPDKAADPTNSLNSCPVADPFRMEITIGCISFTAQAPSRTEVSAFLDRAAASSMFVGPYVTSTTMGEGATGTSAVTFTGSMGISLKALKNQLSTEEIATLRLAAQAALTPTSTPSPGSAP
jgi:hypothetical protein